MGYKNTNLYTKGVSSFWKAHKSHTGSHKTLKTSTKPLPVTPKFVFLILCFELFWNVGLCFVLFVLFIVLFFGLSLRYYFWIIFNSNICLRFFVVRDIRFVFETGLWVVSSRLALHFSGVLTDS